MIKQKTINVDWNIAKVAIIPSIMLAAAITVFTINTLIFLLLLLCMALSVGVMISAVNAFTGSSEPTVGRAWSRRKELSPVIISKKIP